MFLNLKSRLKSIGSYNYEKLFPGNSQVVILSGFLITLLIVIFKTFPSLILPLFNVIEGSHHPTSIPWIEEKSQCQHTGRSWDEDKCWDNEHDPLF
jgi:hypothetical protein